MNCLGLRFPIKGVCLWPRPSFWQDRMHPVRRHRAVGARRPPASLVMVPPARSATPIFDSSRISGEYTKPNKPRSGARRKPTAQAVGSHRHAICPAPAGRKIPLDLLFRPFGARRFAHASSPRLTPWAILLRPCRGFDIPRYSVKNQLLFEPRKTNGLGVTLCHDGLPPCVRCVVVFSQVETNEMAIPSFVCLGPFEKCGLSPRCVTRPFGIGSEPDRSAVP